MSNFDDVVSLLVSDRVKSRLTEQCLKYVLSVENNLPSDGQQWLQAERLSEVIDEYTSYTTVSGTRSSFVGQTPVAEGRYPSREHPKTVAEGKTGGFLPRSMQRDGNKFSPQNQTQAMNTFGRRCTTCGSRYHLRAACKVTEKAKWTPKSAITATVVYNSSARSGQGGSQTPDTVGDDTARVSQSCGGKQ